MSNFRVGQKIVCIDDTNWNRGYGDEIKPVKDGIYTVRGFCEDVICGPRLFLVEIVNRPRFYLGTDIIEPAFCIWRFRPVVEPKRETSIEVFRKLLTPVKELVP